MFENKVYSKIYELKRKEVIGRYEDQTEKKARILTLIRNKGLQRICS